MGDFAPEGWKIQEQYASKSGRFVCLILIEGENDRDSNRFLMVLRKDGAHYLRIGYNTKIIECENCAREEHISFFELDILEIMRIVGDSKCTSMTYYKFRYHPGRDRMQLIGEETRCYNEEEDDDHYRSVNYLTGVEESFNKKKMNGRKSNFKLKRFPVKFINFEDAGAE